MRMLIRGIRLLKGRPSYIICRASLEMVRRD